MPVVHDCRDVSHVTMGKPASDLEIADLQDGQAQ